ncbi:MAG TPA: guanylate kinase [Chloroflexi bacterium]|nr:guanylate kinase [Chloroflexota bacterium]
MAENTQLPDFNLNPHAPLLIVISGLSGAGKDTVVQRMKQRQIPFHFCVTATSRAPREGETDGVDYHFYSKDEFERMIADGELIEHAIVYEQYKGVPKKEVDEALASGEDVIVRVDYQGAASIRELYPQAVLIFLMPENENTWRRWLTDRKQDTQEQLEIRRKLALIEIQAAQTYFDYLVTNYDGDIDRAVDTVTCIIKAEHNKI